MEKSEGSYLRDAELVETRNKSLIADEMMRQEWRGATQISLKHLVSTNHQESFERTDDLTDLAQTLGRFRP
jgi:hypothetical protein